MAKVCKDSIDFNINESNNLKQKILNIFNNENQYNSYITAINNIFSNYNNSQNTLKDKIIKYFDNVGDLNSNNQIKDNLDKELKTLQINLDKSIRNIENINRFIPQIQDILINHTIKANIKSIFSEKFFMSYNERNKYYQQKKQNNQTNKATHTAVSPQKIKQS